MFELFIYILAMAITPGPNTILAMANAAATGFRKGIRLNIGMLIGITIVTLIAWIASELLYWVIPQAENAMRVIAFIYLIFLAVKMLMHKNIDGGEKSASFLQGLILQLVNVKVYLLALTAISAYIMPMGFSRIGTLAVSMLIPIICFLSGLVWALGGSLLKNIYMKHRRLVSIIFALSLLWCALKLFF